MLKYVRVPFGDSDLGNRPFHASVCLAYLQLYVAFLPQLGTVCMLYTPNAADSPSKLIAKKPLSLVSRFLHCLSLSEREREAHFPHHLPRLSSVSNDQVIWTCCPSHLLVRSISYFQQSKSPTLGFHQTDRQKHHHPSSVADTRCSYTASKLPQSESNQVCLLMYQGLVLEMQVSAQYQAFHPVHKRLYLLTPASLVPIPSNPTPEYNCDERVR